MNFIISQFENIYFKNLSKQKKKQKKASSEPGSQVRWTNQTHDQEHKIMMIL
jgi:hypothetical protein